MQALHKCEPMLGQIKYLLLWYDTIFYCLYERFWIIYMNTFSVGYFLGYRALCPTAENMKTSIKPATPTWGNWKHQVRMNMKMSMFKRVTVHPTYLWSSLPGFGASSSVDGGLPRQNGYPKNQHLREAHQTLDKNLGKKSNRTLCISVIGLSNFLKWHLNFLLNKNAWSTRCGLPERAWLVSFAREPWCGSLHYECNITHFVVRVSFRQHCTQTSSCCCMIFWEAYAKSIFWALSIL